MVKVEDLAAANPTLTLRSGSPDCPVPRATPPFTSPPLQAYINWVIFQLLCIQDSVIWSSWTIELERHNFFIKRGYLPNTKQAFATVSQVPLVTIPYQCSMFWPVVAFVTRLFLSMGNLSLLAACLAGLAQGLASRALLKTTPVRVEVGCNLLVSRLPWLPDAAVTQSGACLVLGTTALV